MFFGKLDMASRSAAKHRYSQGCMLWPSCNIKFAAMQVTWFDHTLAAFCSLEHFVLACMHAKSRDNQVCTALTSFAAWYSLQTLFSHNSLLHALLHASQAAQGARSCAMEFPAAQLRRAP